MKHTLSPQRYLILLAVMLTASVGDTLLSHGMTQVGPVSLHHLGTLLVALKNPWVIGGIVLLLGFFASYLTALSWADLTFVLPSTPSAMLSLRCSPASGCTSISLPIAGLASS